MASLSKAIQQNDINQVKNILSDLSNNVNEIHEGKTPLFIASELGNLQVVQLLLDNEKVDVNAKLV